MICGKSQKICSSALIWYDFSLDAISELHCSCKCASFCLLPMQVFDCAIRFF